MQKSNKRLLFIQPTLIPLAALDSLEPNSLLSLHARPCSDVTLLDNFCSTSTSHVDGRFSTFE